MYPSEQTTLLLDWRFPPNALPRKRTSANSSTTTATMRTQYMSPRSISMIGFGSETPEEEKEMPLAAAEAAEAAAEAAAEDIVSELETPESADMRWSEREGRGDALH